MSSGTTLQEIEKIIAKSIMATFTVAAHGDDNFFIPDEKTKLTTYFSQQPNKDRLEVLYPVSTYPQDIAHYSFSILRNGEILTDGNIANVDSRTMSRNFNFAKKLPLAYSSTHRLEASWLEGGDVLEIYKLNEHDNIIPKLKELLMREPK